jgi:hypothetical protein
MALAIADFVMAFLARSASMLGYFVPFTSLLAFTRLGIHACHYIPELSHCQGEKPKLLPVTGKSFLISTR